MNRPFFRNPRGITLIELLIAFAIFALVSGASYRLFVAQGRAYAVQDQVGEIQQNIRAGMELLLRDIRMAGYDSGSPSSQITINTPLSIPGVGAITVSYEYDDTTQYTVAYWRDAVTSTLFRQLTTIKADGSNSSTTDSLLENVDSFNLSYYNALGNAETDPEKIVAVKIQLMARSNSVNPDVQKVVSPRTLESRVALRNLTFMP